MAPAFDQLCLDTSLVWKTIGPRGLPVRRHTKGLALDRERVLPRAGAGHSKLTRIARARNMACQVTKLWSALSTTPPARGGHTRAAPNSRTSVQGRRERGTFACAVRETLPGMVRLEETDRARAELSANNGSDAQSSTLWPDEHRFPARPRANKEPPEVVQHIRLICMSRGTEPPCEGSRDKKLNLLERTLSGRHGKSLVVSRGGIEFSSMLLSWRPFLHKRLSSGPINVPTA